MSVKKQLSRKFELLCISQTILCMYVSVVNIHFSSITGNSSSAGRSEGEGESVPQRGRSHSADVHFCTLTARVMIINFFIAHALFL